MKFSINVAAAVFAVAGVVFRSTEVAYADDVDGLVIVVQHEQDQDDRADVNAVDGVSLTAFDHRYTIGPLPGGGYGTTDLGDHVYIGDLASTYNTCGNNLWTAMADVFNDAPPYEPGEQRVPIVVGDWTDAGGNKFTNTAGTFGFFGQNATQCSIGGDGGS